MQNGKSREISKLHLKDVDVRKTALGRVELPSAENSATGGHKPIAESNPCGCVGAI